MIKIKILLNNTVQKAWQAYTTPEYICKWNFASSDWYCPKAENDLKVGGKFTSTMAAKDGSMSFDFSGKYDEIIPQNKIAYTLDDGRKVVILFEEVNNQVRVDIEFEAEKTNSAEMQKDGWQAILNNYKVFAESL